MAENPDRNDALDRFGTRLEKRFTRKEMREMMELAVLKILFLAGRPFGRRSDMPAAAFPTGNPMG
jgi:hypothetical protein